MDKKKYDDFLPKSDGEAALWLIAHINAFPNAAKVLFPDMTDSEITQYLKDVQEWADAIHTANRLKKASAGAVKKKDELRRTAGRKIRNMMTRAKYSATSNKTLLAGLNGRRSVGSSNHRLLISGRWKIRQSPKSGNTWPGIIMGGI